MSRSPAVVNVYRFTMANRMNTDDAAPTVDRSNYELEVDERFEGPDLDERRWIPRYLPHWTTGAASVARYEVGAGRLVLRIDEDQPPWSPEHTGEMRVSSLQTGTFSGPSGSGIGQHRWRDGLVVREEQPAVRLYTPMYGLFELRARFGDDPTTMAALWMIGYEDAPERSAEICIVEIFGRDVGAGETGIGMGVHPFHDPTIRDEFSRLRCRSTPASHTPTPQSGRRSGWRSTWMTSSSTSCANRPPTRCS